ncbi:MAG: TonB-dependent receptor [Candidatus Eremiobacteraeota bacterium]|nr:TonB-dependent receptor [Candidatus Eremiobacteraeota bacterium]
MGIAIALGRTAFAQATPLLVGVVRDDQGSPVAGASVRALDTSGKPDGSDTTEVSGTFAVSVARPALQVIVSCRYCETKRLKVGADASQPLVVIVTRYPALVSESLSQADLQAVPYRRPSDAAGLLPYIIPVQAVGAYGASASDRNLNLGYSLVLDHGVPAYDLSGQANAFATTPDRSVQRLAVEPANFAYRYGTAAGGGTFLLDSIGTAPSAFAFDTGVNGTVAGYTTLNGFTPNVAESQDTVDGAVRRRAGLDYRADLLGGVLRVDTASYAQEPILDSWTTAVNDSLVHVAYATASRRYVTFADLGASVTGLQDSPVYGDASARSSVFAGTLRVEHPATIATAFGFAMERYSGQYSVPPNSQLNAWLSTNDAYVEANARASHFTINAALGVSQAGLVTTQEYERRDGALTALFPSLSLHDALGKGWSLRASVSDSFRAATLTELVTMPAGGRTGFERGTLFDAGLDYDDSQRLRLGTMVFREDLSGFANRGTNGLGFSLTWQITPLLSLRAWTLHNAVEQGNTPPYLPYSPLTLSRSVVWLTYGEPAGLRFDAIVHRDLFDNSPETDIDGDFVVPIAHRIGLTLGTQRIGGKRSVYAGLRLP